MTDIARLAIEVDPKDLQAAVQQLQKLSVESAKAEVAAKKLEKTEASAALAIANANRQAATQAAQAAAANKTMSVSQKQAAAEGRRQAESAYQAAKGIDLQAAASLKAAQAALQQSEAAQKLIQSNQGVEDSAQSAASAQDRSMRNMGRLAGQQQANMTNIAAQFQDIGVTAAMGMNPMMIGLQQGAQLTGVWGSVAGTTSQKLKTFAMSIGAVLSPMSLVIIALTTGVAWLIQWGMEALGSSSQTDSLTKALENAKLSTSNFANAQSILGSVFDLTTGKIKDQTDATMALARAQAMQAKIQAQAKQMEASSQLEKLAGQKWGITGGMGGGINIETFYGATAGIVDAFRKGEYTATQAGIQLERLMEIGQATKEEYISAAQAVANYAVETENIARSEKMMSALSGDKSALSGFLTPPKTKTPKAKKPEETESEKFAEMMKESDLMIWQLGQEADAAGRSGLAAKEYAYAIQLESEAKRQNIDLTKDGRQKKLDLKAAEMAAAAQKKENLETYYSEINGIQEQNENLKTQIATLGMSETAIMNQMFARKLLNDETFRGISYSPADKAAQKEAYALNAQLTEQYNRQKQALESAKGAVRGFIGDLKSGLLQGKSLWETWGNAVLRVLDRVIERGLDRLVEKMFEVDQASGGKGFFATLTSLFGAAINPAEVARLTPSASATIAANPGFFAKGGAFTNSVVHKPTAFFAKGGTPGVMGEAGPEAIMPLQRGPDGSLGVQMYGGAGVSEPTIVQVIPSEYFDVVVDQRAAKVAAPMVVQGAMAANKVNENTSARRSRRRIS